MVKETFWRGRSVFVTGHTGFKGSWLTTWLGHLGAKVTGLALAPESVPNLHSLVAIPSRTTTEIANILDHEKVRSTIRSSQPEIVFHLAAQPLVRRSYREAYDTFAVNALGTASILEACRGQSSIRSIVIVTTDKCYENAEERGRAYTEIDPLGGHDPYSASKAAAELVTSSYRRSFFSGEVCPGVASARAGNVIGGGDWSEDRLIPDFMRSIAPGARRMTVRSPESVRPWQHVLDCLDGYLLLAERLHQQPRAFGEAFNFGPAEIEGVTVRDVLTTFARIMNRQGEITWGIDEPREHEATLLELDSSKARARLGWTPKWSAKRAIEETADWYTQYLAGVDAHQLCLQQIESYMGTK